MVRTELLPDALLAGGGPAGLALAAELAQRGLRVTVVDPRLEDLWPRSYGAWSAAMPPRILDAAVVGRFPRPQVTFADGQVKSLAAEYVRFDTARVQAILLERARTQGVHFLRGRLVEVTGEGDAKAALLAEDGGQSSAVRARIIVDCRGRVDPTLRAGLPQMAYQSAFGAWLEVSEMPYGPAEMSLMDFRRAASERFDGLPEASFLYAMPQADGLLFAQETVLASRRAASMQVLETRLLDRLHAMGVKVERRVASERCLIPLGPPPPQSGRTLAFGAAAGMVQPASGYCFARSLRLAPQVAEAIAQALGATRDPGAAIRAGEQAIWPEDARRAWALYRLGLETMLNRRPGELDPFWRQFFDLPADTIAKFMDGSLSAAGVARAMWGVFRRLPLGLRLGFVRQGARFVTQPMLTGVS